MMDTLSRNSCDKNHATFNHQDDDDVDIHDHDHDHDHQEESGWTTYLDDFANQYITTHHEENDHQDNSSCSLLGVSPSLVSDAANDAFSGRSFPIDFPAKLKFGRGRTKKICEDDSLEDTASSPVNSPKVSQFEHIQTPPRKIEDYVSSSFVMGNVRGMGDHQIRIQEGDEQNLAMMRNIREGNNTNNMDLRSRGLCVVPISMLANFNGRRF